MDFYPYALREVSVLTESIFGHLRYTFEGVPPQSNSPSSHVLERAVRDYINKRILLLLFTITSADLHLGLLITFTL